MYLQLLGIDMPLLELNFGKTLCYDVLHYHISKADKIIKNNNISEATWAEILRQHIDNPDYAKKVANNITIGVIETNKIAEEKKQLK
jgi:hypothetical protein